MDSTVSILSQIPNVTALTIIITFSGLTSITILLLRWRKKQTKTRFKHPSGMARIPANLKRAPDQKTGGVRSVDSFKMDKKTQKLRESAIQLAKEKKFIEAGKLLEQGGLLRDAIELFEANKLFDEAAKMLMSINRPSRAATIYERNQCFEKAALFYLRAKLVDDAKRCLKQVEHNDARLIIELSGLFAEAGDKTFALTLLLKIGDKDRIIKLTRENHAFRELALLFDQSHTRSILLSSLSIADLEHMLANMPEDGKEPLKRVHVWLNESEKGEWVFSIFHYIGNQRGLAQNFAENMSGEVLSSFCAFLGQLSSEFVAKYRKQVEWTARAMHDAAHWRAAALAFELLETPLLTAKAKALSGDLATARQILNLPNGDQHLAQQFDTATAQLGLSNQDTGELSKDDRSVLQRVFFSIDPDNEINRNSSPFMLVS